MNIPLGAIDGDPFSDGAAVVLPAKGNDGPAIVRAAPNEIELISPQWPMLMFPKLTGLFVSHQSLRISVAVAPDLG
jgi:hypothetical protein